MSGVDHLKEATKTATRSLRGSGRMDGPAELRALAEFAEGFDSDARALDVYGEGGPVAYLESAVAEIVGKPAAAWFPSGIMAQQCILRVWCDRAGHKRIALPELSHLLIHEEDGPQLIHGFDIVLHTRGAEVCRAADIEAIEGPLAAVLVELPLRDGGYLLPTWDELAAVAAVCREHGIPLHIDGARLWESAAWLGHSYAEIAGLADSVYVSFYKGLAGFSGAVVAAGAEEIEEAKLWRRRMGGTIYTTYPVAMSAIRGAQHNLVQMHGWVGRARAIASALLAQGVEVTPNPPHTNAFRIWADGTVDEVSERTAAVTEESQVAFIGGWQAPGRTNGGELDPEHPRCFAEFTVGAATMAWDVAEVTELITQAVAPRG